MSRAGNWVPLTGLMRAWLTVWVLIWPALLIAATDWAFGPASTVTSVAFLISCGWAFLRYRRVSKRIRTVKIKAPKRRRGTHR